MTKISIIVPVYNILAYLPACVESLLAQRYDNLEIILVDDGSTDGCGELCDRYAAEYARVSVIHKTNGGLSSARNAGLDTARGQYVMFVDGDDYLAPNAVGLLAEVAGNAADFDFIQFLYTEVDGGCKPDWRFNTEFTATDDIHEMFGFLYEKGGVAASACTKLYNKTLLDGMRFREGIANEDEQLISLLLPKCKKVIYTGMILYGYVMRGDSIVHSSFTPSRMDIFPILDERTDILRSLGFDDLVAETQRRKFVMAVNLYCTARRGGFHTESAVLKQTAIAAAKNKIDGLSLQYKLVYRAMRVCPAMLGAYYLTRRLFGKT